MYTAISNFSTGYDWVVYDRSTGHFIARFSGYDAVFHAARAANRLNREEASNG